MKFEFQNSLEDLVFSAIYLKLKLLGSIPVNDEMNFIENQ